jgi:hypothetical protein
VISPLALSKTSLVAGDTLTGTATFTNTSAAPITVQVLQITSRPPGGTNAGGPYDHLAPQLGVTTIPPGGSVTLVASRAFTAADPVGAHYAYAVWQETGTGLWNGGLSVGFSVVGTTPAPTPPPPPPSGACPSPASTRLVNVSTPSQLSSAVAGALPGDKIVMAAGTYNMSSALNVSRGGTGALPIQLVGPRTAVLDFGGTSSWNMLTVTADWWIFAGFTHTHSQLGPRLTNANNNVLCDLLVANMGQGGISIHGTSSNNTVQDSTIRDTGELTWWYGEGFYIGSGASSNEPSNFNRILRNHIGPNVRAEHVDVKKGTTGNIVEGNVSDAAGWMYTDGSSSGGQVTSSVHLAQGLNTTYLNNTIINLNDSRAGGFMNWQGSGITYHGNRVSGSSFQVGFSTSGGSGNVIGCDNTVTGGTFANVPCQ